MTIYENLQKMKISNATRAADCADAVVNALEKFAGKSITGNKKKITDAMQAIDPKLYTTIQSEDWLGCKFEIYLYGERCAHDDKHCDYIDGKVYLVAGYVKDNTIDIEKLKTEIAAAKERALITAEKAKQTTEQEVQARIKQFRELKEQIKHLRDGLDMELAEKLGFVVPFSML